MPMVEQLVGTVEHSQRVKNQMWHAKNWSVTFGNKIATVTLELNHNRQDADGGTIDRKSRTSTKGKEPLVNV